MKRILWIIVLTSFAAGSLAAQEIDSANGDAESPEAPVYGVLRTSFRLGVFGGYTRNLHDTQANLFTGGGECGAFSDGTGGGAYGGLFLEIPIVGEWLDIVAASSFVQRGGAFGEVFTGGLPILDPNSNKYVQLERRHSYTADLGYIQNELGFRVSPISGFPLYLRTVGAIGITATQPGHVQIEEILSPSGVLYPETNTAEREVSSGEIKDVGPMLSVGGTVGYPFPLSTRLSAAPEVSYYHPLNDVTPNYRWRVTGIHGGLALRYSFGEIPEPPPLPPLPLADVEAIKPQVVLATVSTDKIEIVETVVTETFPILPYVFFDSASAEINSRYRQMENAQTFGFREDLLPHRSLAAYYEVLNVIGSRLRLNPEIKITLNGTTDGREPSIHGAAGNLARARAQMIKEYLANAWDIDPARVKITTSATPTFPSNMEYAEGAEENRRVEVISTSDKLLQPIIFERFNEHTISPASIPFNLEATSPAGITGWKLDVYAGVEKVWEQGGSGPPPATITWPLDLETAARLARVLETGENQLSCRLTATGGDGAIGNDDYNQPALKSLSPFEVSRLSLIVFDFDKAEINTQNRRMVSAFVAKSVQPTSTATIVGSTDRLGELGHNQQLSEARAVSVNNLIVTERPSAKILSVEGVGPSRLLYNNDIPEGRYYCRTVQVEVRTPIDGLAQ